MSRQRVQEIHDLIGGTPSGREGLDDGGTAGLAISGIDDPRIIGHAGVRTAADGADDGREDGADGEGQNADDAQKDAGETAKKGEAKDYAAMAASDVAELNRLFPSLGITDLRKIDNAGRYGALRDLGLSVEEAFRATNHARIGAQRAPAVRKADGKAHIRGDMPTHQATDGFSMSAAELRDARELFPGKSDKEIISLYRSVSRR